MEHSVQTDLNTLLANLEVEQIDTYLFIGRSPERPPRIFGGQVLAQALNSAIRTVVDDRRAHSMHAYFLRPGDPQKRIVYDVDPIRDGRSFTTRRVVAKQDGVAIFNASVSFQIREEGLEHQTSMPDIPGPDELESDLSYFSRLAGLKSDSKEESALFAIDRRPVPTSARSDDTSPEQYIWFRAEGDLGDNERHHQTLLAFISDFGLLGTSLLPHKMEWNAPNMQSASLDHALWFHRPFRLDDYLLYAMESPSAASGRGFSRGSFYDRRGVLVASTAQEGLIRLRPARGDQ